MTCLIRTLALLIGFAISWAMPCAAAPSPTVDLARFSQGALGPYSRYFQEEQSAPLSLEEALERFSTQEIPLSQGDSISLGIGTRPVWLQIPVHNPAGLSMPYRLSIEIPWLDQIEVWMSHPASATPEYVQGGDGVAFEKRPRPSRFFEFETRFTPGVTTITIRIETRGPMAIPIRLVRQDLAKKREVRTAYEFGLLYGLMGGLALYNLTLFLLMGQKEFGLYSLYLIGFIANSLSYTGQLYTVLTVDLGPWFQDWMDNFLMITYSVAGLHFARALLKSAEHSPRLDRFTFWVTVLLPGGILIGAVFDALVFSLLLAFLLNTTFALLFIVLGVAAWRAAVPPAKLFLISSVQAALCIGISTAAVGGLLPLNDFTFRLIEIGMSLEALLLAIILAQHFRLAQEGKQLAETFARTDPLTGLNNRRGFRESADKLWETLIRQQRHLSIIMLDIDFFKQVNDQFGHAGGDKALKAIADAISQMVRAGDLSARWGGEEFILLLPETDQNEALAQAERLRATIETLSVNYKGQRMSLTASLGVSGTLDGNWHPESIERMIDQADRALYTAKNSGRNQVYYTSSPISTSPATAWQRHSRT